MARRCKNISRFWDISGVCGQENFASLFCAAFAESRVGPRRAFGRAGSGSSAKPLSRSSLRLRLGPALHCGPAPAPGMRRLLGVAAWNGPQGNHVAIPEEFQSCFDSQRAAHLAATQPSHAERVADLEIAFAHVEGQSRAAHRDEGYGNRASFETLFAEYFVVLEIINDTIKHLRRWMRPQRRRIDFMTYPGASNRLIPPPLGVVE